jgi:GNAT superfamily N-acetyltransferase
VPLPPTTTLPQDFSGFRMLLLYPRDRCMWPAPFQNQTPTERAHPKLGAPLDPWPALVVKGKPLTAATIRSGPGYLEVPFVATHESKRGRGYGRCCVEAIEEVARALDINRLLLCRWAAAGVGRLEGVREGGRSGVLRNGCCCAGGLLRQGEGRKVMAGTLGCCWGWCTAQWYRQLLGASAATDMRQGLIHHMWQEPRRLLTPAAQQQPAPVYGGCGICCYGVM